LGQSAGQRHYTDSGRQDAFGEFHGMISIVCSINYLYLALVHILMLHEGHQETMGQSFFAAGCVCFISDSENDFGR
jgi:hypothetical protein